MTTVTEDTIDKVIAELPRPGQCYYLTSTREIVEIIENVIMYGETEIPYGKVVVAYYDADTRKFEELGDIASAVFINSVKTRALLFQDGDLKLERVNND